MKYRSLRLLAAALLPVMLAAACGTAGGGTTKTQSYDNDGYLGISNTNPNLQTGPSYHTYQVDTDMMHSAVIPIAGVRKVRITTNGTNASVRITAPKDATDADLERIRGEALQALQHNVPRYDFKVTVRSE